MSTPSPEDMENLRQLLKLAEERDRVDDATRDRLYKEGFATAHTELFDGHAGYFLMGADGDFMTGIDKDSGLPVYANGDVISSATGIWRDGFEAATKQFIKQHGPPWNSHLGFINELADNESYFVKRSAVETPICLRIGESPCSGPEPGLTMHLIDGAHLRTRPRSDCIRLTSQHLYAGVWRGLFRGRSSEKIDLTLFAERTGTPASPDLKPGTTDIWLRFYSSAKQINFFWGPPGSRLCFFQFDGACDHRRGGQPETRYAALDLCLGDWIPSYVQGVTEEMWG